MHPCPTLRVLVIDDDPEMHRLVESLENPHWELITASNQAEAVEKLGQWRCWVILSGLKTPIQQDIELLARLQAIQPDVRLLVFANQANPEEILAAMKAGVVAVFRRSFPVADVAHFLQGLLEMPDWRDGIEVVSARPDWIALRVVPRIFTADRVTHYLEELQMDLPPRIRQQIGFAFREMLINAIEHGAKFDTSKRVEVTAMRTQRTIVYHLRDPGEGFNGKQLPHAAIGKISEEPLAHLVARTEAGMRMGGFGMLLAKELVDELVYNEKGNEVLLIKHLDKIAD